MNYGPAWWPSCFICQNGLGIALSKINYDTLLVAVLGLPYVSLKKNELSSEDAQK